MSTNVNADDFCSQTEAFMTWMQQRPGTNISPKIQISDLRSSHAGRGIGNGPVPTTEFRFDSSAVATADIEKEEALFSIPLSDVLTVQSSSLRKAKPSILERLDAWNALVLVMIHEESQGTQSKWWPYLQILPRKFDTLIYWSASELAELDGSAVLEKIGRAGADSAFTKVLLPIVQKDPDLFGQYSADFCGPNARTALLELAHRMATLIMAYGFDLEAEESSSDEDEDEDGSSQSAYELNKGMVPLADLFNADAHLNNAHLLQNENSMTMIALRDVSSGQQIFNDFGQLPRSDLLRRYGYVTDNYRRWDVVEIDIETITRAANEYNKLDNKEKRLRLELAASWDVLQDGYDLNRPLDEEVFEYDQVMLLTITALLLNPADFEEASEEPPERPPKSIVRTLSLVLQQIIASRQTAYKTTIAEDHALLNDSALQGRHRMAVEVRLGEKEILALAADQIDKRLAENDGVPHIDRGLTYAKRRRLD